MAFQRLADEFGFTQAEIADRVGMDRSSVANHLRLLELDSELQTSIAGGQLTMGHGRALLAASGPRERLALAREAMRKSWSVRELERRVRSVSARGAMPEPGSAAAKVNAKKAHMHALERELSDQLGREVSISPGRKKGKGTVALSFYSMDDFEHLLGQLGVTLDGKS